MLFLPSPPAVASLTITQAPSETRSASRYIEFDYLRVYAFLLLILYHVGMIYVEWDFHIKYLPKVEVLEWPMIFLNRWRMPLVFLISGAGVWFSLQRRTGWQFAVERWQRLFIPLVFGMFVVVVPQVYYEAISTGWHFTSLAQFYGTYLDGHVTWNHLWFLPYILTYSMLLLPVILVLRKKPSWYTKSIEWLGRPGLILAPVTLLWLADLALRQLHPTTHNYINDWFNQVDSFLFFGIGALLVTQPKVLETLKRQRWVHLALGVTLFVTLVSVWWRYDASPSGLEYLINRLLNRLNTLVWVFAVVGFGRAYLTRDSAFIRYATPAVFPFYILHQTITIAVGFYLIATGWPWGMQFALTAVVTFAGSWMLYEFIIRRWRVTRLLFGMKQS